MEEWERIEVLLQAAERQASRRQDDESQLANEPEASDFANDRQLLPLVTRALAQCSLRRRHFPAQVSADNGWALLLDLLSHELEGESMELPGNAHRWGMSEVTAARHVAGLVADNLVVRIKDQDGGESYRLHLTDRARSLLRQVLMLQE
jgi:hypothetical protein